MHTIGIAAIIVKIDRLVQYIPEMVIHLCNKHGLVLIQIDKETKYESIILEILEPIINRNMYLLNRYYDVHSEITRIAMKMPSLESVLKEFKTMINMDLSLVNKVKNAQISTNTELEHFQVINILKLKRRNICITLMNGMVLNTFKMVVKAMATRYGSKFLALTTMTTNSSSMN